jgi:PAS domain S-box-containing protein
MGIKILLVDEHPIVRQGLRALLDKEPDFEVVAEAGNGQAVVRLARELAPDQVLLGLSDLAGADLIRQVLDASPGVKVMVLSFYNDRRFVVNVLKAGASGYLLKDCAFEELANAIRTVQEHRSYLSPGLANFVVQDYLEALRESEARFRTIFEGANLGIALVDGDGRIVESNPALQRMLGYSEPEMRQKVFQDIIIIDDAGRCQNLFKELVTGKLESCAMEKQYQRRDGSQAWGRLTISPFRPQNPEHQFAIAMVEDVTEQKQAENEIRHYQEQLRSIAMELSLTEERERRRLATELHDHVGQILALAQIKLGALRESASASGLAAPMDEIRRLIEQTIQYTRSLTFELSPPILYDLGFEAAVEWLAELMQDQHGVRIKVQSDHAPKPLGDEIKVLLFQAMRELFLTEIKNGNAKNVWVAIARKGNDLQVRVDDDGTGWERQPGVNGGDQSFGLFSIQERLKHFGGRVTIEYEPERGSSIILEMPLTY